MLIEEHTDQSFTFVFEDFEKNPWETCQAFIDDMKAAVPWADRAYNPDTKEWTIEGEHREDFQKLREKYFGNPDQLGLPFG